ncbi:MAG: hypothetical protein CM1200mP15_03850 [Dehalococcoidia bacterium]|nr:MAG: hypothetical protein CM1200mP15_03850 [Dehalococcoidia bacterium]
MVDFDESREPVYIALSDVITQFNIPVEYFNSLLSGMEMDLSKEDTKILVSWRGTVIGRVGCGINVHPCIWH